MGDGGPVAWDMPGFMIPLLDYEKHECLYLDGICHVFPKQR
jgi:hypothetical protein